MLDECVVHLQDSLETLRNTVHNMYSHEKRGTEHIKNIVDEYKYCNAQVQIVGQFHNCSERVFKALSYVLKEALTNTSKHSMAETVHVTLTGEDSLVSLCVKDDGIGCNDIRESLGIRSMRDRINGLNGQFTIDGADGMLIRCVIPLNKE